MNLPKKIILTFFTGNLHWIHTLQRACGSRANALRAIQRHLYFLSHHSNHPGWYWGQVSLLLPFWTEEFSSSEAAGRCKAASFSGCHVCYSPNPWWHHGDRWMLRWIQIPVQWGQGSRWWEGAHGWLVPSAEVWRMQLPMSSPAATWKGIVETILPWKQYFSTGWSQQTGQWTQQSKSAAVFFRGQWWNGVILLCCIFSK